VAVSSSASGHEGGNDVTVEFVRRSGSTGRWRVTETTTFKSFSVGTAGNVERGYDPDDPATRGQFRQATITISPTED
jgi:hypothetical protein